MTVIRPNSISGINSITAQVSALNFYDSAGAALPVTAGAINVDNINATGVSTFANATIAGGSITGVSTIGVTTVTATNLTVNGNAYPTAGPLSNRNKIINGAMEIAQRGTSSSSNGYVSLDRWYVNQSGGSTTFSQETFAVGSEIEGISTYGKLVVSSSSDYTNIRQRIEDVKSIPTGTVTVSFWAKGTAPSGGLNIWIVQNFGSGGSVDVDIAPEDVSLTATWTKYSVNFTIPSISGKTIGSSNFLQVAFGQYSNTGTTAWELNITGVQLETGTVATPFERRSYGQELSLCQRYCWVSYTTNGNGGPLGTGAAYNATSTQVALQLPVSMRTTPSATTVPNGSSVWCQSYVGASGATTNTAPSIQSDQNNYQNLRLAIDGLSGMTAGQATWTFTVANGKLILSAEL